jgi:hypothetical protein
MGPLVLTQPKPSKTKDKAKQTSNSSSSSSAEKHSNLLNKMLALVRHNTFCLWHA